MPFESSNTSVSTTLKRLFLLVTVSKIVSFACFHDPGSPLALPVILVRAVLSLILALDGLVLDLALEDVSFVLGPGSVGRRHQIPVVVDQIRLGNAPLQHLGGKLVRVAEVREAHDVVLGLPLLDQSNRRDDFDAGKETRTSQASPKTTARPGSVLSVSLCITEVSP